MCIHVCLGGISACICALEVVCVKVYVSSCVCVGDCVLNIYAFLRVYVGVWCIWEVDVFMCVHMHIYVCVCVYRNRI